MWHDSQLVEGGRVNGRSRRFVYIKKKNNICINIYIFEILDFKFVHFVWEFRPFPPQHMVSIYRFSTMVF